MEYWEAERAEPHLNYWLCQSGRAERVPCTLYAGRGSPLLELIYVPPHLLLLTATDQEPVLCLKVCVLKSLRAFAGPLSFDICAGLSGPG